MSLRTKVVARGADAARGFLRHSIGTALSQTVRVFPGRTINIGSSRSCRTGLMVFPKIRSFRPPWPCAPMITRSGRISRANRTISRFGDDECEIAVSTEIPCARSVSAIRSRYSSPASTSAVDDSLP